ncbi:probable nucleoredoxin 1 [Spinacia oleracea]|uniref:Probable nucleoredoxin 1 n=1 Tax=Spinacia oleracea TaxID=3562 RepID=A0ABM3RV61_SPIOL|nr:probable nucleoredoxin 1 [Spinacia oleracea]
MQVHWWKFYRVSEFKNESVRTDALKNLKNPSSLEDFLCCKKSDFVFRKVSLGNGRFRLENVAISELKSKLVGLYLYTTGHLFPLLPKIAEECLQSGNELEIVVVYVPGVHRSQDPRLFLKAFYNVLAKRNLSWWIAPYNNTTSIVLEEMFEKGEKVVILGPDGQFVDTRGAELMQLYGSYGYPFTLDSIIHKTLKELKQVTLESFLKSLEIPPCTGKKKKKKKVLFYFDYPFCIHTKIYDAVKRFSKYDDVEIIMVSFSDEDFASKMIKLEDSDNSHKVVCHTKSFDRSNKFFLRFFNSQFPTIVAFGKDGRICSVYAHLLPSSDENKAQIKGNLLEEVTSKLAHLLENYVKEEVRFYRDNDFFSEGLEYRRTRFW